MAMARWLKWTFAGAGVLLVLAVLFVAGGLWYVSGIVGPDVAIGQPMPEILLTSLDGVPIDMTDYRGNVLVLDFWSSW